MEQWEKTYQAQTLGIFSFYYFLGILSSTNGKFIFQGGPPSYETFVELQWEPCSPPNTHTHPFWPSLLTAFPANSH